MYTHICIIIYNNIYIAICRHTYIIYNYVYIYISLYTHVYIYILQYTDTHTYIIIYISPGSVPTATLMGDHPRMN